MAELPASDNEIKPSRSEINRRNRAHGHLNPYRLHPLRDLHRGILRYCHRFEVPIYEPWEDLAAFVSDIERDLGLRPSLAHWLVYRHDALGFFPGNVEWRVRGMAPDESDEVQQDCLCPEFAVRNCPCPWAIVQRVLDLG